MRLTERIAVTQAFVHIIITYLLHHNQLQGTFIFPNIFPQQKLAELSKTITVSSKQLVNTISLKQFTCTRYHTQAPEESKLFQ